MEIFAETSGPDLAPLNDSRIFAEKIEGNNLREGDNGKKPSKQYGNYDFHFIQ